MMAARITCVALLVVAALAAFPDEGAAVNFPSASCNGGGCGDGWYKGPVSIGWAFDPGGTPSGCGGTTVSEDTSGATFTCTVTYPQGTVSGSVTVRKDSSPPGVNISLSRDPDSDGWYTQPVSVSVSGDGGASGLAGCSGGGTYGGPDGAAIALSASCTDGAGNNGSASVTIKYDGTAPTVTAAPSRSPDVNGWYNHPVDVAFRGTDSGSGVKECSPLVTYKGPDANPAKLVGQCRDAAGHLSQPGTAELRYDATPPAPPKVKWARRGGSITLTWTAGPDVVRAAVVRAPGLKSKKSQIVYQGKAKRFVDRKAAQGKKYWYEVTLFDQAGNRSAKTLGPKPKGGLRPKGGLKPKAAAGIVSPAQGAVVARPPLVTWSPVAKARFYNLQLWHGRLKVLTTWVRRPKLALKQRWTSQGKRYALVEGTYRLYVWPAFGTTKTPRYGKLLGQVGFVVRRR